MSKTDLIVMKEAATALDVDVKTVRDVVRKLQITPKDVPHNGNAKGLDRDDMNRLRKALGMSNRRPATV
jgi:hypothetical protein